MKMCSNCGAELKDDADVCDKCGALSDDLQSLLDELTESTSKKSSAKKNIANKSKESNSIKADNKKDNNIIESKINTIAETKIDAKEEKTTKRDKIVDGIEEELSIFANDTVLVSKALNENADNKKNIKVNDSNKVINNKKQGNKEQKFVIKEDLERAKSVKEDIKYKDINDFEKQENQGGKKRAFVVAIVLLLLAGSCGGGYAYYQHTQNTKKAVVDKDSESKEKSSTIKDEQKKREEADKKKAAEEAKKKEELKKAAEEEAKRKAEEEVNKQQTSEQKATTAVSEPTDANGNYTDEPSHLYEENVPEGDARLYWVSDRTLTQSQLQAVANKFGADWTIDYIYAKHGLIFEDGRYNKYGFVGNTNDRATAAARFNGAERRNTNALANY